MSDTAQDRDIAERQLLAAELELPGLAQVLNDIREFDWKVVNKLRKEDLERISGLGFQFKNHGVENRRQEFRAFLLEHPTIMSENFEHLMKKLQIFAELMGVAAQPKPQPKKRKAITHNKAKVIEISSSSHEEEDEEIQYEKSPLKKNTSSYSYDSLDLSS